MSKLIVVTRPQPEADDYARELKEQGFDVFIEPMLVYQAVNFIKPDLSDYAGLLLTSSQGLAAFFDQFSAADAMRFEGSVYCVGQHTARQARAYRFQNVVSVDGTGKDLAEHVAELETAGTGRFLHVRGRDIAFAIGESLRGQGVDIDELIVYEAVPVKEFSGAFKDVLVENAAEVVTFYSKRTAENFLRLISEGGHEKRLLGIKALSISPRVLECVRMQRWADLYVSETPDRAGMLKVLNSIKMGDFMSQNNVAVENAQDVIEAFGGIRPMAKKMDVAVTTVQGWKKRNTIPAARIDDVIKAAREHDVDLSGLLDGAPIANQNASGDKPSLTASRPQPKEHVEEIAQTVESVLSKADSHSSKNADQDEKLVALKQQISEIERHAVMKSAGVSTAIVVALVILAAVAMGYVLWPRMNYEAAEAERLRVLEQELSSVKKEQSFLGTLVPEDLGQQIEELKAQAQQTREDLSVAAQQVQEKAQAISEDVLAQEAGTLEGRLGKLEGHAQDVAASLQASPTIAGLLSKFQTLQADVTGQQQLEQSSAELQSVLSNLQASVDGSFEGFNQALEAARAQSTVLGQTFEGVPQEELKAAALLLGMTQVRSSLNRDNDAFEGDLDLLLKLVGTDNPALNEALVRLAPHAQSGVLTPAGLSGEFRTLAGDAVAASLQGEDVSMQERAKARLNELFQVEQNGELVSGTPTQAALLKTENLLQDGDLQGAIATAQTLEGGAAQVLAPWIEDAQATLAAEQAKGLLNQSINTKAYGDKGGITASGLKPAGASGSQYIQDPETGVNVYVPAQ